MRINSMIKILIVILTTLSSSVYADSFPSKPLVLQLNDGTNVVLRSKGNKFDARYQKNGSGRSVKIDENLTSHLTKTDEAILLFKAHSSTNQYVILSREPSRQNRAASFCGAGYEDLLVLVEASKKQITLLDTIFLQSCIKSILLRTDNGEEPLQSIVINKEKSSITFQWLGESEDKKRIVTIQNNKFVLK